MLTGGKPQLQLGRGLQLRVLIHVRDTFEILNDGGCLIKDDKACELF
jgi:hypothetical protein